MLSSRGYSGLMMLHKSVLLLLLVAICSTSGKTTLERELLKELEDADNLLAEPLECMAKGREKSDCLLAVDGNETTSVDAEAGNRSYVIVTIKKNPALPMSAQPYHMILKMKLKEKAEAVEENKALHESCVQSSTWRKHNASLVVNGIISGRVEFSSTTKEVNAWWMVNLRDPVLIRFLNIHAPYNKRIQMGNLRNVDVRTRFAPAPSNPTEPDWEHFWHIDTVDDEVITITANLWTRNVAIVNGGSRMRQLRLTEVELISHRSPNLIDSSVMKIRNPLGFSDTGIMNDNSELFLNATPVIGSSWYRVDLGHQYCLLSINWTHWPRMENLAFGKESSHNGNGNDGEILVDGKVSLPSWGKHASGNLFTSEPSAGAWWMVSLGRNCNISLIAIIADEDYDTFMTDTSVLGSTTRTNQPTPSPTSADWIVLAHETEVHDSPEYSISLPPRSLYRHISVYSDDEEGFTLTEVFVFGFRNILQNQMALASSSAASDKPESLVVNGDLWGSTFNTLAEPNQWWLVRWEEVHTLLELRVFAGADRPFNVSLLSTTSSNNEPSPESEDWDTFEYLENRELPQYYGLSNLKVKCVALAIYSPSQSRLGLKEVTAYGLPHDESDQLALYVSEFEDVPETPTISDGDGYWKFVRNFWPGEYPLFEPPKQQIRHLALTSTSQKVASLILTEVDVIGYNCNNVADKGLAEQSSVAVSSFSDPRNAADGVISLPDNFVCVDEVADQWWLVNLNDNWLLMRVEIVQLPHTRVNQLNHLLLLAASSNKNGPQFGSLNGTWTVKNNMSTYQEVAYNGDIDNSFTITNRVALFKTDSAGFYLSEMTIFALENLARQAQAVLVHGSSPERAINGIYDDYCASNSSGDAYFQLTFPSVYYMDLLRIFTSDA